MKTNLIQRQLHVNAAIIVQLQSDREGFKAEARTAQLKGSRKYWYSVARKIGADITKLADIQRELKRDMLAHKLARVQVYKKHGKDDARYTAWVESKQAAERTGDNYAPVQFFPPVESAIACGC